MMCAVLRISRVPRLSRAPRQRSLREWSGASRGLQCLLRSSPANCSCLYSNSNYRKCIHLLFLNFFHLYLSDPGYPAMKMVRNLFLRGRTRRRSWLRVLASVLPRRRGGGHRVALWSHGSAIERTSLERNKFVYSC